MSGLRLSNLVKRNKLAERGRTALMRNHRLKESRGLANLRKLSSPRLAETVGLEYVTDGMPGIRRKKSGEDFCYLSAGGKQIDDEGVLKRIRSLVIPPAWTEVWICANSEGHLQATGHDARGRKQYRYHARWREVREETKYARMISFGRGLSEVRNQVRKDMALPGLSRRKVLATLVRLLEISLIRVGNEEYERSNASYGLTTMKDRHVDVNGSEICFRFRGKSGKYHQIDIQDRHLARIVKKCMALPGQDLFQYVDYAGEIQDVKSTDVNEYLQQITGADFTAKDFRTWAGTILAAMALQEFREFDSQAEAKRNIARAIELVAARLGNTPTICRKCYVHPEIVAAYLDGTLARALSRRADRLDSAPSPLRPEEAAVLALLQRRLTAEKRSIKSKTLTRPAPVRAAAPESPFLLSSNQG